MKLTVNGEELRTEAATLKELIEQMRLRPEGVAAEVNLGVVSRKDFPTHRLREGDAVEIVNFVGGG